MMHMHIKNGNNVLFGIIITVTMIVVYYYVYLTIDDYETGSRLGSSLMFFRGKTTPMVLKIVLYL